MQFKREQQNRFLSRPKAALLIDDDPVLPELLRPVLLSTGYVLESLRDASEVCTTDLSEFDVIILDLMMPGTDGIDVIPKLAKANFSGGLILISGLTEEVLQTASATASVFMLEVLATLRKPVKSLELQALLSAYNYTMLRRSDPG
jgi:CheY-like chemotaxis protein